MDIFTCNGGYVLDPSTLGAIAGLALTTFVWTARNLTKRRQAERARCVQVVQRLQQYWPTVPRPAPSLQDRGDRAAILAEQHRPMMPLLADDRAVARDLVGSGAG